MPLCHIHSYRPWSSHQMAGGGGGGAGCRLPGAAGCRGCFALQRQRRSEHREEAVGGPCPQMVFHLLSFHTALPSSQLWESALRSSSDPSGSAFVTAHLSLSSSLCCFLSRSCSFVHNFSQLSLFPLRHHFVFLVQLRHTGKILTFSLFFSFSCRNQVHQKCN